jgi:phosphoribosylaminoimidazole carboxylase
MLAASASLLNIKIAVLDSGESAPAKQVVALPSDSQVTHIDGSFKDPAKIKQLAAGVDVLTVEIEHVDVDALEEVQKATDVTIHPSPSTIRLIQDKYLQKEHLKAKQCPVSEFVKVGSTVESITEAVDRLGLPLMLKSRTLAYDGRGNYVLKELSQAKNAIEALGNRGLYAEKWVPFTKEIAVMVLRSTDGTVSSYPTVETVHKNNICHLVFAPLRSRNPSLSSRAQAIAEHAISTLHGAGVFGVEMFLMEDGASKQPFQSGFLIRTNR